MSGATIVIRIDGNDVTDKVVFKSATFDSLLNAQPGTCEFTVNDEDQTFAPVTGMEIELEVDGALMWGGYLMQYVMIFPFPADMVPTSADDYSKRQWIIRGSDYNILFDKLVIRNTSNYLEGLPFIPGDTLDGDVIKFFMNNYVDVPAGFDVETYVDNTIAIRADNTSSTDWAFLDQATKIRDQFDFITQRLGNVYYFDASKNLHWHPLETQESRWGFSDQPNYDAVTASPVSFQGATWGFREVEATEDGTGLVNDALIWGGSEWAGSGGSVVFARSQDATSISDHGRWQLGELHFGEHGYGIQDGVDARADVIVSGPPGVGVGVGGALEQKGLRYPQWSFDFAWHDKDVPAISGVKDHLRPGQLVTVELNTFGVTKLLPLRSLRISFPEGNPHTLGTYVRFEGTVAIQLSDPFTLWRYLTKRRTKVSSASGGGVSVPTSSSTTTSPAYGSFYSDALDGTLNSSNTVFTMSFGYIAGSTSVYLNGLLCRPGQDYTESDPAAGEITFSSAPDSDDELWIEARTVGSTVATAPPPIGAATYIAPSGSDSTGDGSIGNPWKTIQKFIDSSPAPGDVLYCRGGTYTSVAVSRAGDGGSHPALGGAVGNPITIRNYPGETPLFVTSGTTDGFLMIQGATTYVVIDGLQATPAGDLTQTGMIYIGDDSSSSYRTHHITIRNCKIYFNTSVTYSDHTGHAIYLGPYNDSVTIEYNQLFGPGAGKSGGYGLNQFHSPGSTNVSVHHNIVKDWRDPNTGGLNADDPAITGSFVHNTLINNTIHIKLQDYSSFLARNNAGTTGTTDNLYDPVGTATQDHNFWGQAFDSNYLLLAGQTGRSAATDGTDAGALDW